MRRNFIHDGRTYVVDGARPEWVLHFWDEGGVDIGCARNLAGVDLEELTDAELCQHLAKASRQQVPNLFANR